MMMYKVTDLIKSYPAYEALSINKGYDIFEVIEMQNKTDLRKCSCAISVEKFIYKARSRDSVISVIAADWVSTIEKGIR